MICMCTFVMYMMSIPMMYMRMVAPFRTPASRGRAPFTSICPFVVACVCFSIEFSGAWRKTAAVIIEMTIIKTMMVIIMTIIIMTMMIMIIMLFIMMISIGPVPAPRIVGRQQQDDPAGLCGCVCSGAGEEHEEVCEPDNG